MVTNLITGMQSILKNLSLRTFSLLSRHSPDPNPAETGKFTHNVFSRSYQDLADLKTRGFSYKKYAWLAT